MADEFQYKISIDDNEALAAFGRIAKKAEQTAKEAKAALGKIELGEQAREVERAFALIQKSGSYSIKQLTKDELELQKALDLLGSTGQFNIGKLSSSLDQTTKSAKLSAAAMGFVAGITQQLTRDFVNLGEQALTSIKDAIVESVDLAKIQVAAENQLEAAIRSTGNAAGYTAQQYKQMAGDLQNITNYGDEATLGAESLLLTFKSIGGEIFPRALKSILDVSTAMEQDLKTSTIQIGKALNEPVEGLAALRRVGIQFTDSQEKQIKTLVEAGNVTGAQVVILKELESQFGGSAEAAREADGGITAFSNAVGDLQEKIGLPILGSLSENFESLLTFAADNQIALDGMATSIGKLATVALDFVASGILDQIENIDPQAVERLAASMDDFAKAMSQFLQADISADLNGLINTLTILVDTLTNLTNQANQVGVTFGTVQDIIKPIKDVFIGILFPVYKLIEGFGALSDLVETITGVNALEAGADVSRIIAENSITAAQRFQEAAEFANQAFSVPTNLNTRNTGGGAPEPIVPDETADELEKALKKLSELERDYARDRIDILRKAGQKTIEAEQDAIDKRIDQARDFLRDIEDIEKKNAQAITDSGTDLRRDEQDAYTDYNRKLIELEKDGAKGRIKIEEDYRDEIKKIQSQFEFDSEEAARNRDAVTFLRLQRERDKQIAEARTTRDVKVKENATENEEKRAQLQQELQYELEDARLADERRLEDLRIRLERELEEARLKNSRELDDLATAEERKRAELKNSLDIQLGEAQIANDRRVSDYKESLDEEIAALVEAEEKKVEVMQEAVNRRNDLQDRLDAIRERESSQGRTSLLGGRAFGGPVGAGQSVIVGERRPEVFTPNVAGYVTPQITSPLLGGSSISNSTTINNSVNQSMLDPSAQSAMMRAIARMEAVKTLERLTGLR